MKVSTFVRFPVMLLLLAGLTLTIAPQTLRPTPAAANTLTTTTICGVVSGYIAPTFATNGYITIAGVVYPIAANASITNLGLITSGASICLAVTFDAFGNILAATVTTGAATGVSICGVVTSYLPPSSFSPGYITINGTTYPIAPGVVITGAGFSGLNTTVCLQATLNSLGQIASGTLTGSVSGVGSNFRVCGTLELYNPPTAFSTGSITVNGRNFAIAPGAFVSITAFSIGSDICLSGTLNGLGQIVVGNISQDVNVSLVVCGAVTLYVPATPTTTGNITINGTTYVIAPGTILVGDNLIISGGIACLNATLGTLQQIVSGSITGTAPPLTAQAISICAPVTTYTAATLTGQGVLSLGGKTYFIAPGVTIIGATLLTPGTNVCVLATLNSAGQIVSGTATFNGAVTVSICGVVSSYSAATTITSGSIIIAGITFPIAAGTVFTGPSAVALTTPIGITITLNGQGQIASGNITSTSCTGTTISGPISSYVPPTGGTVGSITIGGATFPVAVGTVLTINGGTPLSATLYQPRSLHPRYNIPE